jgi:ribonuclease BN (tRNA processing enzyme)
MARSASRATQRDRVSGVKVRFLGTGDAFASGGRSHACIHVTGPGISLLLDCGGSALPAITAALDPGAIEGVAITHLHGDHFGGLPYLVMQQHFLGRRRPLVVGGPPSLAERLARAGSALYSDFFGVTELAYELRIVTLGEAPQELGGARVSAHPVRHVPASEPHGLRVLAGGSMVAYSGDAAWSEALVELARGAELFICESTTFERQDPVHLSYRELASRRNELDCRRVVVTHLGPETIEHLSQVDLEHAEDGMVLDL